MSTAAGLWRYPVKAMMGEEVRSTKITEKGIHGDRTWALVDLKTKKWAEISLAHHLKIRKKQNAHCI